MLKLGLMISRALFFNFVGFFKLKDGDSSSFINLPLKETNQKRFQIILMIKILFSNLSMGLLIKLFQRNCID